MNLKKKLAASTDVSNRVEKFVACRSKDPELREVYIVEGDSAMTSCKLARNAEFQAIIPVRGKTLNCLKCDYARIFKSDIIVDLLRVIGCGVEFRGKERGDLALFDLEQDHNLYGCGRGRFPDSHTAPDAVLPPAADSSP